MSVEQQKKFLTKLHKELSVNSDDYRRKTANKRMHTFVVTRRAIRRGMKDRLEKNYPDISKTIQVALRSTGFQCLTSPRSARSSATVMPIGPMLDLWSRCPYLHPINNDNNKKNYNNNF